MNPPRRPRAPGRSARDRVSATLGGTPVDEGVDRLDNWSGLSREAERARRERWLDAFQEALERDYPGFAAATAEQAGTELFQPIVGRGSAYADIDGDGDLDVIFTQVAGPPVLLRNDQSRGHHFVRMKLVGTKSNRDALGTSVKLTVNGQPQWREVMTTKSYLSASELPVTFGLGNSDHVDAIEITWPGGVKQTLTSIPVDKLTVVEQPR